MRVGSLRDRLYMQIIDRLGGEKVKLNGHPKKRLPNTLNISIKGMVGGEFLGHIPEIAASTASACHSGSTEPSSVLLAMGLNREDALGALRLTLGRWTSKEEVDTAFRLIIGRVSKIATVHREVPSSGL